MGNLLDEYLEEGYEMHEVGEGARDVLVLTQGGEPELVYREVQERELHYEDEFSEILEDVEDIAVPNRVDSNEDEVLYEYCGESFRKCEEFEGGRPEKMGELLGRLHVNDGSGETFSWYRNEGDNHETQDYDQFLDGIYESIFERRFEEEEPEVESLISDWFAAEREELDLEAVSPTLSHGDFVRQNVRYDEEDETFYVIDFELAKVGDPMDDLALTCYAESVRNRDAKEDVVRGYQSIEGTEVDLERLNFYFKMNLASYVHEKVIEGEWSVDQGKEKLQGWLELDS